MRKIKKNIYLWVLATGLLMAPVMFAHAQDSEAVREEERVELAKGQMLCQIAERAFESARGAESRDSGLQSLDIAKCEKVLLSEDDPSTKSLVIALKEYAAVDQAQKDIYLEGVISNVGRMLKNSVDNPMHHLKYNHCLIHRQDLMAIAGEMELAMGPQKGMSHDYHKLMIESLADKQYDMALYAYVKIAEDRCN